MNIIDTESGRPLQLMGHSFRVLNVDGSYSAGRSDLRLLSGDAFSVYIKYNELVEFIFVRLDLCHTHIRHQKEHKKLKAVEPSRSNCLNHYLHFYDTKLFTFLVFPKRFLPFWVTCVTTQSSQPFLGIILLI